MRIWRGFFLTYRLVVTPLKTPLPQLSLAKPTTEGVGAPWARGRLPAIRSRQLSDVVLLMGLIRQQPFGEIGTGDFQVHAPVHGHSAQSEMGDGNIGFGPATLALS